LAAPAFELNWRMIGRAGSYLLLVQWKVRPPSTAKAAPVIKDDLRTGEK